MKYLLVLLPLALFSSGSSFEGFVQNATFGKGDSLYYYFEVDTLPEFQEGNKNLLKFIRSRINWPNHFGGEGIILLSFVVETDGLISFLRLEKGLINSLDQQCLEVVQSTSGKWKPGKLKGKKVRTQLFVPIHMQISP